MSNPGVTEAVDPASLAQYDMIIDVRSPSEFAEDHIPGAINLPVLDDIERARVGTIYVQESRFLARRLGAGLVARNISRHLEVALADAGPTFRPLVYCWRGGQRSNAMALVFAQIGWRTIVLSGGYKTYRRAVQSSLYAQNLGLRFVVLEGGTGTGKTEILKRVGEMGGQVLDLEGLARHRGSLFGALADTPQPSQKWFESSLLDQLARMDAARPVLVEAESSKIGRRTLPPALWQAMLNAPRIALSAPIDVRTAYLVRSYPDVIADRALLEQVLSRLEVYPGRKQLANWRELADAGAFAELARQVVERHYDPSYRRKAADARERHEIALPSLADEAQAQAAQEILRFMEAL